MLLDGAAGNVATRLPASRSVTITALGVAQILGWGTSFYFPAVLAPPILVGPVGCSLGWSEAPSIILLDAGLIAPSAITIGAADALS